MDNGPVLFMRGVEDHVVDGPLSVLGIVGCFDKSRVPKRDPWICETARMRDTQNRVHGAAENPAVRDDEVGAWAAPHDALHRQRRAGVEIPSYFRSFRLY